MIKELKSMMTTSISEVLETMFYMPLEFDDYGSMDLNVLLDAPDLRICKLSFSGKLNGFFLLAIREKLLVSMARDFMGEEEETISRQHTDGIIKEVLNMVAGHMFSKMDEDTEYHLGIPELTEDQATKMMFKDTSPEYLVVAESIDGVVACLISL